MEINLALSGSACRVQHVDRYDKTRFAYTSPLQPYLGLWGMFWTTFFILLNGFTVFYKWDVSKFLTSCTWPFVGLFLARSSLTRVSRYQHPNLRRPLFWLQDYQQDEDPQVEGCRPREQHSFDGRDRKTGGPPDNNLGQDLCRGVLSDWRYLVSLRDALWADSGYDIMKERRTVFLF